jgi:hypothetical protein
VSLGRCKKVLPRPTEQDRSSNGPEFFISNLFPIYTRDGAILFPARSRTARLGESGVSGQPRGGTAGQSLERTKVTQDRWGEKLGAPRMGLTAKADPRRF